MFELISFIFIAVWLCVFFGAITKAIGGSGKPGRLPSQSRSSGKSEAFSGSASPSARKISASGKLRTPAARPAESLGNMTVRHEHSSLRDLSGVMMEDRKNDWLARQLREEARIAQKSDLDLGAAHERECAADELRKVSRK